MIYFLNEELKKFFGYGAYMKSDINKFLIRFPIETREQVHISANRSRRSINKEITIRLEHSLKYFPSLNHDSFPVESPRESTQNLYGNFYQSHEQSDIDSLKQRLIHRLKNKIKGMSRDQILILIQLLDS